MCGEQWCHSSEVLGPAVEADENSSATTAISLCDVWWHRGTGERERERERKMELERNKQREKVECKLTVSQAYGLLFTIEVKKFSKNLLYSYVCSSIINIM